MTALILAVLLHAHPHRQHAPRIASCPYWISTFSRFPHAQWPNTAETDWCGEHRPREEAADG